MVPHVTEEEKLLREFAELKAFVRESRDVIEEQAESERQRMKAVDEAAMVNDEDADNLGSTTKALT